jgi:hypothetical protein
MATRYPNGLSTYDEYTDSYGTAVFGDTYIHGDATISGYVRGNIKLDVLTDIDCTNDVTLTGDQKKARVILVTKAGSGKKLILDNGAAGSFYYISNGGANELEVRNVAGTAGVKIAAGETVTCITTSATAIIRTTDNIADAE